MAFCIAATCRPALHNRVAEVRCSLPQTTDAVSGFDEGTAVVEPGHTGEAKPN